MTAYAAHYGIKRVWLGDTPARPNVITHKQAQSLGLEAIAKAGTEGISAVKWTADRRKSHSKWKCEPGTLHIVNAKNDQYIFRFEAAKPEIADISRRYDLKEDEE